MQSKEGRRDLPIALQDATGDKSGIVVADGVIDFDAVVRDPEHPSRLLARFALKDHLYPNDDGYKAMEDAIDLNLFKLAHLAIAVQEGSLALASCTHSSVQ